MSVVLLSGEAGYFSREFERVAAAVFLALFAVALLRGASLRPAALGALLAASAALACVPMLIGVPFATLAPLLVLAALWRFRDRLPGGGPRLRRLTMALAAYLLLIKATAFVPEIGFAWRALGLAYSAVLGAFVGEERVLGPSLVGLAPVSMALIYVVALKLTTPSFTWRRVAATTVAVVATSLAFQALVDGFEEWALRRIDPVKDRTLYILIKQNSYVVPVATYIRYYLGGLQLLAGGVVAAAAFPRRVAEAPAPAAGAPARRWALAVPALFAAAAAAAVLYVPIGAPRDRILISDKGRFDWDVPVFGAYGGQSSGMFGMLPDTLRRMGYDVEIGPLDEETLADRDLVITINHREAFEESELEAVHDFVRRGGRLWVLGDHTRFETDDPYDQLLEPTGIRWNFDTAQPVRTGWGRGGIRFAPAAFSYAPERYYRHHHWVGASLDISPTVRPLIIGQGFADYGKEEDIERNKLGDRRANPEEQIGDLVLAAEDTLGDGRVVAFADTTTFQNRQIVQTWRYTSSILAKLTGPDDARLPSWLSALLWLAGAAALAVHLRSGSGSWPLVAAVVAVTVVEWSAGVLTARVYPPRDLSHPVENRPLALIACDHAERLSFDSAAPDAIDGLALNLIRSGYLAATIEEDLTSHLSAAAVLVIVAPARAYTEDEIDAVEKFVRAGGHLIVTVGWEESAPAAPLLARFAMRIDSLPLGHIKAKKDPPVVGFRETWPVHCDADDAEALVLHYDKPIVVARPIGSGRVTVVGDTYFLHANNIEESGRSTPDGGISFYLSLPNVEFFRRILQRS